MARKPFVKPVLGIPETESESISIQAEVLPMPAEKSYNIRNRSAQSVLVSYVALSETGARESKSLLVPKSGLTPKEYDRKVLFSRHFNSLVKAGLLEKEEVPS
jgi:hypothetical protein